MTIRMSDVVPEPEPEVPVVIKVIEVVRESVPQFSGEWPECEFEGCGDPVSYKKRDRFGEDHRSCTGHKEDLDFWVRVHNGWEESVGTDESNSEDEVRGGEGLKEDGPG